MPRIEFRPKSRVKPESAWLERHRHRVTSQLGQDGIFAKILEIIGAESRWCCEFGAFDGRYLSNTWDLIANRGWSGVLLEGDKARCADITTKTFPGNPNVHVMNEFVHWEGQTRLDALLARTPMPKEFDLLSIDIDGNDWHVWNGLKDYRPRIVCIECNPTFENDVFFVQDADPKIREGCSMLAAIELGKEKGYELVSAPSWDAIFVAKEYFPLLNIADNSIDAMFSPNRYVTRLGQGVNGKFYAAGNLTVQWCTQPDGSPTRFPADHLQVLPDDGHGNRIRTRLTKIE